MPSFSVCVFACFIKALLRKASRKVMYKREPPGGSKMEVNGFIIQQQQKKAELLPVHEEIIIEIILSSLFQKSKPER